MPIVEDRLRAKVPCGEGCNLRWRERNSGTVEFRHGNRSKTIKTQEAGEDGPVTRAGWLTEAIEWCESLHPEGDW